MMLTKQTVLLHRKSVKLPQIVKAIHGNLGMAIHGELTIKRSVRTRPPMTTKSNAPMKQQKVILGHLGMAIHGQMTKRSVNTSRIRMEILGAHGLRIRSSKR